MKKKILLVDDDQLVANLYRNKLLLEGFTVEVAHDGRSGLDMLDTFRPDALLLDLMLPEIPGVEVIRGVRAHRQSSGVPIVVFSNTYLSSTLQEAWKAGATKCLTKANCTPAQVVGALRSVLETASAPQAATNGAIETPEAPSESADANRESARHEFTAHSQAHVKHLRVCLKDCFKADAPEARSIHLQHLRRSAHALTAAANIAGLTEISHLGEALEALVEEIQAKPESQNESPLRTVAAAVDLLALLSSAKPAAGRNNTGRVLVVDDEVISRRAVTHALEKARLKAVSVESPDRALNLAAENRFDLIILDVDMPKMNGYELCSRIRALATHKGTPVVFVTSMNDFESRANSTISGGNDFITKPFLFVELTVKALVHVLRARLRSKNP